MSDLGQLKGQVDSVARDAQSTAAALGVFKSKFKESAGRIEGLIGGTAQGADKNMIQTLTAADRQVDAAIQALQAAATAAAKFAASL
ncbi:hypothetical protein [Amycolatopsis sp. H20-H5]|uniref:hypothetical protein n=1 Tax=Amycolatopsis sp. H20-H5 TaxID=3046309 RepID=UPI002DB9A0B1|nr:hypothetical protein [Amycolatopsis sp. H20-H5]MEC3977169.1 hypothetical protein [Amycolatopsis sp. H20-H5]